MEYALAFELMDTLNVTLYVTIVCVNLSLQAKKWTQKMTPI